ncbi:MAG: hypothetical protein ABI358_03655 [Ginsengibacter sp.]
MDILQNNKHGEHLQDRLKINRWSGFLLLIYIFSMPFVSALAFTNIISLPLIFSVLLFAFMVMSITLNMKMPENFVGFDLVFVALFLFLVTFSFVINGIGNAKSLNHTVAYFATFLFFYVAIKFTLFNAGDPGKIFNAVLRMVTYATLVSALFANAEFITSNFFGINLNEYIPRPNEEQAYYDATVLGIFYRARGFAAESGHFAFMMEFFSPLSIYYMYFSGACKWKKHYKVLFIFAIVTSFIFAVSTASFVIVPAAVLIASLFQINRVFRYIKKNTGRFLLTTFGITAVALLVNYFFSLYALILLSVNSKINNGLDYRQENINFFFKKFFQFGPITQMIGSGPAGVILLGYGESSAILNLYYSITFELGFLGLFLLLALFFYVIFNIVKINSGISFFLLVSFFSGAMHFYFIANFWYPWFWFIAAFAIFCNKKLLKSPAL